MAIGNIQLTQVGLQSILCTAFNKIVCNFTKLLSKISPYNILVGGFYINPDSNTISIARVTGIDITIAGYNGVTFA